MSVSILGLDQNQKPAKPKTQNPKLKIGFGPKPKTKKMAKYPMQNVYFLKNFQDFHAERQKSMFLSIWIDFLSYECIFCWAEW